MPLYSKLAVSANAHPADVTMVKGALTRLGFYQAPAWGIDEFPNRALFDAIQAFQKASGLKADGVIDPGGKTEAMLLGPTKPLDRDHVSNLPYIIPKEPDPDVTWPLPDTIPIEPGLPGEGGDIERIRREGEVINFSTVDGDTEEKKGEYIWRTQGDGRVRESHAERDGKTFSWESPPDGGHPGEAPNCRCWAEDVKDNEAECKALRHKIENQQIAVGEAYRQWEILQKELRDAIKEQQKWQDKCNEALAAGGWKTLGGFGGGWVKGGPGSAIRGGGSEFITSAGDVYDACTKAGELMEKVDELDGRENSAAAYLKEQQEILGQLRLELADLGCDA